MASSRSAAQGLPPIHYAILRRDPKLVRSILKAKKLDLNMKSNIYGMTALHLAVVMGYRTIVGLLVRHGAQYLIQDDEGRTAQHYARDWKLRQARFAELRHLGIKNLARSKKGCRQIARDFRNIESLRSLRDKGDHPFSGSFILRDKDEFTVLPRKIKAKATGVIGTSTCGFIVTTNSKKVEIFAVSGWANSVPPFKNYTERVRQAARVMGFGLPSQMHDDPGQKVPAPEHQGRYYASHVEKQLSTAWVTKMLQEYLQTDDLGRMAELRKVEIPEDKKKLKIFLDHGPCEK